jgi:Spy/CpxP family protein refolding chaperone
MKLKWFVLGAVIAVLAAGRVAAAEEPKEKTPPAKEKAPPSKDQLRGEYAIMAVECKLTDDQQKALRDKITARRDAQEAWMKANGAKLESLQEAVKTPKDPNDKEAIKRAAAELKALEADRLKIQTAFDADVRAIMNPEQQVAWEAFRLCRAAMGRYKRLILTDEQTKKIKEACAAPAKEIAEIKGDEKAVKTARGQIEAGLRKNIEETILTAEQREALAALAKPPAEKKPPEGKKPAEEKK